MADAVVIGAGLGGLAAAIDLASRGLAVTVVEAAATVGGKAGTATVDGVTFDTGPSVLTLPAVFDDLLGLAGIRLADHVELTRPDPAFRYLWPDGTALDVAFDPEHTLANVATALGADAEADLAGFLAYAKRIWDVAAPRFVLGPAPTWRTVLSLSALRDLAAIDPLHTMESAITARIRSPHLRMVLARYATYNGSDPRHAPATLHCIAHVELGLGGYGVKGGISALVEALMAAATRLGVDVRTNSPARRVVVEGGVVHGVELDGEVVPAHVVVANADVGAVFGGLIATKRTLPARSTSGWTAVVRARRIGRAAHTVVFPGDYDAEFADLFDRNAPPVDPTAYLCAQEVAHGRTGWDDAEPVFVMANAPAAPGLPPSRWDALGDAVLARCRAVGLLADEPVVWQRTPADLANRFPGSDGALYGGASNDAFAAFRRPANRVAGVRGLYLASGSAHPGGGMPLCALSGRAAAAAAAEDHAGGLP